MNPCSNVTLKVIWQFFDNYLANFACNKKTTSDVPQLFVPRQAEYSSTFEDPPMLDESAN